MLFNKLDISPRGQGNKRYWHVTVSEVPHQRINERPFPHAMGVYYYPRTKSTKKAFHELVDVMIKAHEEQIALLEDSLAKLRNLTPPK